MLKAPFCVHPATGRVCVPVDPRRVDEFDPENVPTVGQLLRELNDLKSADNSAPAGDGMDVDRQEGDHHSGKIFLSVHIGIMDVFNDILFFFLF